MQCAQLQSLISALQNKSPTSMTLKTFHNPIPTISSFTTQLIYPYFSDKNSLSLGLLPSGYHLPPSSLLCSPIHVSLLYIYQDFSSPIMFFTTIFLANFNVKADDPIQQSFFGFLIPSLLRTSII